MQRQQTQGLQKHKVSVVAWIIPSSQVFVVVVIDYNAKGQRLLDQVLLCRIEEHSNIVYLVVRTRWKSDETCQKLK